MEVFWEQGPRGGTYDIYAKQKCVSVVGVVKGSERVEACTYLSPDIGLGLCCCHLCCARVQGLTLPGNDS